MNTFAKTLRNHIAGLEIKIQNLSRISGVDRTLIQKMMKGDRVPADQKVIDRLISAMMLTPVQADELRSLYHIARIGEDVYHRHQKVKSLLESFGSFTGNTSTYLQSEFKHNFNLSSESIILNNSHEVNRMVKSVIEEESMKTNGSIKLIIQPEYTFLVDLLSIVGDNNHSLEISHIFCLQKSVREDDENRYNLNCIKNIAPLLTSGCKYSPYIYYDEINAHLTSTTILPYLIFTDSKVIRLSYDCSYGILLQDSNLHTVYTKVFQEVYANTIPLLNKFNNPLEYYSHYAALEKEYKVYENDICFKYSLFSQPCLVFFITEEIANKYVINFPQKDELVQLVTNRSKSYLSLLQQGMEFNCFFTLKGLDDLWNYGRIDEIPSTFYNPIEKEDCLKLLNNLYRCMQKGSFHANIIDTELFKLSDNLVISALSDSSIELMYENPQNEAIHFILNEKSISFSIFSFLEYLKDSDLILSTDATLEILKSKIEQYSKELRCA